MPVTVVNYHRNYIVVTGIFLSLLFMFVKERGFRVATAIHVNLLAEELCSLPVDSSWTELFGVVGKSCISCEFPTNRLRVFLNIPSRT